MATDDPSMERTSVKTYVPAYQKEEWARHAEALGMSQSEFIRTMVQAGRADFEIPSMVEPTATTDRAESTDTGDFEDRIVTVLKQENVLDWDELVDQLIDDVEDDLDAALGQLQDENRIRYSGRDGGYMLIDDE
ncbi:DUF5805 domain-containing protein [Natrarchaeobaculum aegyptiacum]|uniref:Uncharacterized protein n=1 Tax=Natrarchaeobaculum aegyptiacum TaxID=745377 RepID=A0A2Z2I1C3_9EURY|nr:DUF5805 domain-containing protein [Natrarchaeobaculum aegyptiacum]ARS91564.1 hypothetical protein B1756_18780 [Natrarchaeobaculum aegyptiacum]